MARMALRKLSILTVHFPAALSPITHLGSYHGYLEVGEVFISWAEPLLFNVLFGIKRTVLLNFAAMRRRIRS
jgi:hypothetical protein